MKTLYKSYIAFKHPEEFSERSLDVVFYDNSDLEAVQSAFRFAKSRVIELSDIFGIPLSVRVGTYTPGVVDANGHLSSLNEFRIVYSWKIDSGHKGVDFDPTSIIQMLHRNMLKNNT